MKRHAWIARPTITTLLCVWFIVGIWARWVPWWIVAPLVTVDMLTLSLNYWTRAIDRKWPESPRPIVYGTITVTRGEDA